MSKPHSSKTANGIRKPKGKRFDLHIVSESTGGLARHITSVVLSQFPKLHHTLHQHPFCSTAGELHEARRAIKESESPIVFSALTKSSLKRSMANWCVRHDIAHCDLVGSVVDFVTTASGQRPVRDASRAHRCNEDYYRRIDAWEFTLQHDDSRRLETIDLADIVLLGVSRAGKTPLAAYLGSLGYRVANVAIAPEAEVPWQVAACHHKTVGLTVRPERLAEIRERRFELNGFKEALRKLKSDENHYYSRRTANRDIVFAEEQFRKLRIRSLDMTDLTVEESAARVLNMLELT